MGASAFCRAGTFPVLRHPIPCQGSAHPIPYLIPWGATIPRDPNTEAGLVFIAIFAYGKFFPMGESAQKSAQLGPSVGIAHLLYECSCVAVDSEEAAG